MASDPLSPYNQAPSSGDPLLDQLNEENRSAAVARVLAGGNPEAARRANALARQYPGVPAATVEQNITVFEAKDRAKRANDLLTRYPAIGKWAAQNPRAMVAAQDDTEALGLLGKAWEGVKNIGYRLGPTMAYDYGARLRAITDRIADVGDYASLPINSVIQAYMTQVGAGQLADPLEGVKRRAKERGAMRAEAARYRQLGTAENKYAEMALSGLESVGPMLLPIPFLRGVPAASRGSALAGSIAAPVAGGAFDEARSRGLPVLTATNYAAIQGGSELLLERLPAIRLVEDIVAKAPIGSLIMRQLAAEIPQEAVTTEVQAFTDWAYLNPEKTLADFVAEFPDRQIATAIGTTAGVGAVGGIVGATRRSLEVAEKVSGRMADARQARQEQTVFDNAEKAALASKMRKTDPEGYNEVVRAQADDAGVDSVFVPGSVVQEYMQSDFYDPDSDPFASFADDVAEAAAVGGDVVLPVEFALGTLPGTKAWEAIKGDMRLSPGGFSTNEAAQVEAGLEDDMARIADEMGERYTKEQTEGGTRERLAQVAQQKLQDAGATPYVARTIAEYMARRVLTRSQRMGREAQGTEFGELDIRGVLPPALEAARKADNTDLVINALRRGKSPDAKRGQSLLEWIADRGGIEDRGGDIASMGGDKWHREKKFRKKLLKPFDDAQGNMIGKADDRNTVEALFDAAISEGFFPELLAQRESGSGYDAKLDTAAFLDAVRAELAGSPVYAREAEGDFFREAAAELEQLLAERGLDPDGLSDKELRDVIARLSPVQEGDNWLEQMPDVIDIDGVSRPTRNSEGMPIAGTEEGVRAFWNWFGDSKVVDEEGRPLVVYHGTPTNVGDDFAFDPARKGTTSYVFGSAETDRQGFFFAENEEFAATFAGQNGANGDVLGVYLAVKNPFIIVGQYPMGKHVISIRESARNLGAMDEDVQRFEEKMYRDDFWEVFDDENGVEVRKWLEAAGFDGVFMQETDPETGDLEEVRVAFSPTQIKSINNRGTFAPDDARILYQSSRASLDVAEGRLLKYAEAMGWKLLGRGSSRISLSTYQTWEHPDYVDDDGDNIPVKLRFSDHMLPGHHSQSDFDVLTRSVDHGSLTNSGDWLAALTHLSKLSGVAVPDAAIKEESAVDKRLATKKFKAEQKRIEGAIVRFTDRLEKAREAAASDAYRPEKSNSGKTWYLKKDGGKIGENFMVAADGPYSDEAVRAAVVQKAEADLNEVRRELNALKQSAGGGRILYQPAYHGSPHIFDRFSLDKIGTGEGAQAYGWGLYFAGKKEIAEFYKQSLRQIDTGAFDRGGIPPSQWRSAEMFARQTDPKFPELAARDFAAWNNRDDAGALTTVFAEAMANQGRLYQVDIPEDNEFLLWDKPLSEQPDKVKAALVEAGIDIDRLERDTGQQVYYAIGDSLAPDETGNRGRGRDKAASQALHEAGIAGIKYLDGGSRADGEGTFNYVVFDDSRVSITAYEQAFGDGPRGRIMFPAAGFGEGPTVIELFQSRNLSTMLHELGHLYLEELRFDAMQPDAPEQIKRDWQTVQDWFAANGQPVTDGIIPTEAHEMWARAHEAYLMEGKSPAPEMRGVMEVFRGWLRSIYETIKALRTPITPEIREVFDRLIATDEQIQRTREAQALAPLFKDAAAIGMTGPEFDAYTGMVQQARGEAQGKLLAKTMAAIRARETKAWNEAKRALTAEVAESVNNRPLFKAFALLKTRPIDAKWIVAEFGADALSLLPMRVPPIYKDGGADPSLIAEQAGYPTGRDMIEAMIGAEIAHREAKEGGDQRTMRNRMIDTEVLEEMNRRYGDPLSDGSIEREALEAVNGEMTGEVIATEIRVLARRTGKTPTPYAMARQWARERVRRASYAQESSPAALQRHARNVAKAGREAEKAMLAGNLEEAFAAKQRQMLSSALLAEAKKAGDEVEAARKRMNKIALMATSKTIDQDYLDQAHALLEAVDLRQRSQRGIERKKSFDAWAASKAAIGEEVYRPAGFDYTAENWTRLPVEEMLGLNDTIASIIHLGRLKKTLIIGKEKRDYNEARGEWLNAAETLPERPASDERNPDPSAVRGILSNLIRIDMMAKVMDAGDPNGLMTRLLAFGAKNADNTYNRIQKDVLEPIIDAYMNMKGNRLHERVSVPEWIDYRTGQPMTFMRSELMAIALNMGNDSNMRKMIAGESLLFRGQEGLAPTEAGIMAMLSRELNEAEWRMVELAWRRVDSMWPELAETERDLTGVMPEKVEPRMVQTPYGVIEGGYWPVVYDKDPARVAAAGVTLADNATELETVLGLTGKGVATNKGYTVTRTDYVAPMYLNFEGVMFGHVNTVAKRIAYQRWGTQALKVIRDPRIKAMWARKLGEEYHSQLEPWLRDTINQGVPANTGHLNDFNWIIRATRMNMTIMGLVGRFTTLFAQIGGVTSSVNAIGLRNMLNGYGIVSANYSEARTRIFEASPLMARRIIEFDRDQAAALAEMSRPRTTAVGKALKPVADVRDRWNAFGFHMIGAMQLYLVDMPTWAGAYAQATASAEEGGLDLDHDTAVDYADQKVEQAQGAGRPAQLAAVQRGGEMMRILTTFYTFFGTQLNYQWEMTQDARAGNYGKATKTAFWIMVATPLLGGLLADAIRGELPDEDDEDTWLAWALRKVFFGMFTGIPIVRDFANQKERQLSGKYAPDPVSPWVRFGTAISGGVEDAFAGVSQTEWYQEAEELLPFLPDPQEVSDKWLKHTLEAVGYATGTGLGQFATTSQLLTEDDEPEGVIEWGQAIATGRVPED